MTNVLVIGIVGAFIILIIVAYLQSKKTRQELIAEMKEEILSKETAPVVAKPAPVVAKVKPAVVAVKEIPAVVEALAAKAVVQEMAAVKAAVQEMVTTQEAPAPKPRNNRRRGRPGKKQETNPTK
jgi:hypothetical protein